MNYKNNIVICNGVEIEITDDEYINYCRQNHIAIDYDSF